MSTDRPIRTEGNPSYGVTLHYNAGKTKVSARSHFPRALTDSDQLHVDKATYLDASPASEEFTEYATAMMCTIARIEEVIAELQGKRNELETHLNESMMIGAVSPSEVKV